MQNLLIAKGVWLWIAWVVVPLLGILLIVLLTKLPPRYRRPLIGLLVFLAGLFYAAEYFLPVDPKTEENLLSPWISEVVDPLTQVLSGMLIGIGLISISRIHLRNVALRRPGWGNSLALLLSAIVMAILALWSRASTNPPPVVKQLYDYLFVGLFQSMDSAMFSLIAFYILSAAYRAFRIRSVESSILMLAALIVVLGLSFGVLITGAIPAEGFAANFRIETWSNWLLAVVSSSSLRAIDFGVGIGALAMALRLWLGLERGTLFGE